VATEKNNKPYIPIHLVEDPAAGFTPIADIGTIQRDLETNPAPKPTPVCRMALRAIAGNVELFKRARDLGIGGDQAGYLGVISAALNTAIRLKTFENQKKAQVQPAT
jgi:hypothetical protein